MKKMRIKTAAVAVLTVAAVLSTGCKKGGADAKKMDDAEIIYAVSSYKTAPGNLDEYLEFGGDVDSVSAVNVMPDMAGKISRILVSVGDMVRKDQVLAYVDASRPGMNYSESPVRAPIAGRITSIPPTIGATVSQAVTVARIARTDDLEIKVNVAERFISRIKQGQTAIVTFDAYPGVEFKAKVFEVSPVLDTSTRTMSIKLRIEPPDSRIKVGMYARVRLVTDSVKNAIVIPNAAMISRDGKPFVFVIANQKEGDKNATVRLQAVKIGISVDNKTEITEGLSAGDEIVIKGQSLLNDGAQVNIISTTDASK
ncbi:MAG: efflux RND transporter periplasmic adaptor subunit [Treponema sp.]|nr:efflux RND transporter periplasmic adaptor subunit [Treponema sp.]